MPFRSPNQLQQCQSTEGRIKALKGLLTDLLTKFNLSKKVMFLTTFDSFLLAGLSEMTQAIFTKLSGKVVHGRNRESSESLVINEIHVTLG